MKIKTLVSVLGMALVLTACGGGTDESEENTGAPEEEPAQEENGGGDFDAQAAEESYQSSCIQCHGDNLEGMQGPALTGTDLSTDEIVDIIQNGQGSMPAVDLPDDEAENLAKWIQDQ
ncbi:c-type cytochrome [Shouchella shacheensis]|uniref:c-type cytochrome n=1 Tax=Shouchella shacheensis TaxID=1649580 RepID=UPI000A925FCE|nr:cytochrome c [Shouchella shacheensis]